jgi:hypothetical protein
VKGFNGTNQRTVSVAAVHTWFSDDVSHSDAFSLNSRTVILACLLSGSLRTYIKHGSQSFER